MPHFTLKDLAHDKQVPANADVVVIGAGMSGLYATWRILKDSPDKNIVILERSHRTGGRLDSDLIEFNDEITVKEEEGGMRFTFDNMDDLMSLFLLLDIDNQIVPFPMNSGGNNRLFFRGESFNNQVAKENNYSIWQELYNLEPIEQGIDPKSIINTVFNRILDVNPNFTERPDKRTPTFWQKFRLECQWNGVCLKDWTLWNLLTEMGYSNECITLLYRLLGFNGTFLSQMNAGVAYQLLEDFPNDPQFKTFKDGFSTLPNALVNAIGKERIFLKTHLESIDRHEENGDYALSYQTTAPDGTTTSNVIHAKQVILGLPRLALEKLFINSNALNRLPDDQSKQLWDTLQTTTNQALLKINLYYDKAWWGNNITGRPPVSFGPNFSDLPLGSVYPFYAIDNELVAALEYQSWLKSHQKDVPEHLREKIDQINQNKYEKPAALTIYCDFLNINFWKALQHNGPLFNSPLQEKYKGHFFAASQSVVNTATEFFKSLFSTHYVPQPTLTSARIWDGSTRFDENPSEQFGYGVHQWALHANDKAVMEQLAEPLPGLYICGEAYSDYQGWVEGALRSTDIVLAKGFNLPPISAVYEETHQQTPSAAIKESYNTNATHLIREYIDPDFEPNAPKETINAPDLDTSKEHNYHISLNYFSKR
ncbi:FAD-dependent oxidoreductase [Endozoicomonas sp. SM1973]|uniref:FAD-dependent oxidoreductase n=1 Tax=Spartinivicinus marinus TaxID=2994442 RepID=A0A853I8Y0_9GAMM|nr:FAD-dependent oxidoreductase [Spartinivicinus marinus]NYZ67098.1 FAD-dependent oxidoreductase [Spartinivicinus marinus]